MIKNFTLVLILLPTVFLGAQRTVIAGKFPYQRDVSFSAAFISNQVVLIDEWGKVTKTSDAQGLFHLELKVDKPSIIRFTQRESIELYIRPGDSLWIEMINGRNVTFGGTAGRENNLLFSLNRPFIPIETQENPQEYSALIDTLYQKQRQSLKTYQAEQSDEGFVSLFTVKAQAQFLEDKIKILQFMQKEAWEGALKDRVERQIHNLPLVDEVRSEEYIRALNELFTLEVKQITGTDWSTNDPNSAVGYSKEVFHRHWQERLAGLPKLKQYFEIEEWIQNIQFCSKLENLPQAAADLEQIKQVKDYPVLVKEMESIYRQKVIVLKMKKLPAMTWQTASGQTVELDPSSDQRTLVVFWDANQAESVEAYRKFQEKTIIRFPGSMQDSLISSVTPRKLIWIQVGGDLAKWKEVINTLPNTYSAEHYAIKKPEDIAALKPYLYEDKLPVAFDLRPDLSIEGLSNRPTVIDYPSWEVQSVGGRVMWKRQRD
ncbi:hypothetical protein [Haliscomenobacter sp.]|uniref:hypothetical protein n=1 Tax=Haliscomenobacter sp. TaxID=2717303 RepID=UPI003BAA83EE